MLTALIELALANRVLVIVLVLLVAAGGAYSAATLPIDAVPDMTNVQVQVITEGGSLSPLEVERYLTYPVEAAMNGLADVEELRSVSKLGISVVTVVFGEGVDIYRARQLVNERLVEANSRIAAGRGDAKLGALSTALGEVLQFEVRGDGLTPMELRSVLEWEIAPQLRRVPGVTDVNSHGGLYKSYEVAVDPERLAGSGIALQEIVDALEKNNASGGGGYIVHSGEQQFLRGEALLESVEDIQRVVVRSRPGAVPILIEDLCEVRIAPLTRQGLVTRDGRGEVVTGMVMMLLGENSRTVVEAVKERIDVIQGELPDGVTIEIIYDRTDLIGRTLHTVLRNLVEGGVLVVVVLLILLGSFRAGLIVALAIPLSVLFAANLMQATGITASLMSLGAIDFGLIVDSSVIMIENCMRRLAHRRADHSVIDIVRDAAVEVRKPTMFGELIIAIVYLPILTLSGTEGKLFRPMAWTVLFALAGSLVLSLTLMPVLASLLLPANVTEKDVILLRLVKRVYRPCLAVAVRRPVLMSLVAVMLLLGSLPIAARLGAEFMPRLDEGDLLIEANRLPSATLEDAVAMSGRVERLLRDFPEVKTVFCKTGRPEIANDVMGVQQTDIWVMLRPVDEWPARKSRDTLIEEMSAQLHEHVPEATFGFTQPIEMRVDELVAGVKADVAVLLYGDDLRILARKGKEIEAALTGIPGAADVKADYQANIPSLTIRARPEQLARHGINAATILDTVAALGGVPVGEVFEGRAYYPIVVRIPQKWREIPSRLERIPISAPGGAPIPLGELADIELEESPPGIEHEATRRRTFVSANVRGRDVASFVHEAKSRIARDVRLPPGYTLQWGGDFENLQSASLRLAIITPIVLVMIFLLLYTTFKSASLAVLIFLAVPMAASGGVAALAIRGMPFSISAGVGFIALCGVAVLNGLVWVSSAENLRQSGVPLREAAFETGLVRIRPILMTAMVASFGFLPMALSSTAGAEIQRPLASVVIGGLVTSTLLTALVIPAIYPWFSPRQPAT